MEYLKSLIIPINYTSISSTDICNNEDDALITFNSQLFAYTSAKPINFHWFIIRCPDSSRRGVSSWRKFTDTCQGHAAICDISLAVNQVDGCVLFRFNFNRDRGIAYDNKHDDSRLTIALLATNAPFMKVSSICRAFTGFKTDSVQST